MYVFTSDQFSPSVVANSSDPMDCSMLGFPDNHQLPDLTQTQVHQVGDATQPSHHLSSPSPPAFSLSQHQGLFQLVGPLHQMAKILELQLQHQSFQLQHQLQIRLPWGGRRGVCVMKDFRW